MGIFKRIVRIFKSNTNYLLDSMEDSSKIANYQIVELQDKLNGYKSAIVDSIVKSDSMKRDVDSAKENVKIWEKRLEKAISLNNRELAIDCMKNLDRAKSTHSRLKSSYESSSKAIAENKNSYYEAKDKLNELKSEVTIANMKKTELQIKRDLSGFSTESYSKILDKAYEPVRRLQAEESLENRYDYKELDSEDESYEKRVDELLKKYKEEN